MVRVLFVIGWVLFPSSFDAQQNFDSPWALPVIVSFTSSLMALTATNPSASGCPLIGLGADRLGVPGQLQGILRGQQSELAVELTHETWWRRRA